MHPVVPPRLPILHILLALVLAVGVSADVLLAPDPSGSFGGAVAWAGDDKDKAQ